MKDTAPWWASYALACAVMLIFGTISGLIIYRSTDSSQYAQMIVAAIIALVTGGTGFYWGSSSSSEKKDTTIASTAASLATSAPVVSAEPSDAAKALATKISAA